MTGTTGRDGTARDVREATTRTVHRYYEAVDDNDLPALLDVFADDAVYRRPGYPPIEGRAALRAFYEGTRIIAEGRHALESVLVAEDGTEAAVRGAFDGRSRTGEPLAIRFADFFRFRDGRVVERSTYFDAAGV